jgi:hypothetical protein
MHYFIYRFSNKENNQYHFILTQYQNIDTLLFNIKIKNIKIRFIRSINDIKHFNIVLLENFEAQNTFTAEHIFMNKIQPCIKEDLIENIIVSSDNINNYYLCYCGKYYNNKETNNKIYHNNSQYHVDYQTKQMYHIYTNRLAQCNQHMYIKARRTLYRMKRFLVNYFHINALLNRITSVSVQTFDPQKLLTVYPERIQIPESYNIHTPTFASRHQHYDDSLNVPYKPLLD